LICKARSKKCKSFSGAEKLWGWLGDDESGWKKRFHEKQQKSSLTYICSHVRILACAHVRRIVCKLTMSWRENFPLFTLHTYRTCVLQNEFLPLLCNEFCNQQAIFQTKKIHNEESLKGREGGHNRIKKHVFSQQ
jgi:hypothetical protein